MGGRPGGGQCQEGAAQLSWEHRRGGSEGSANPGPGPGQPAVRSGQGPPSQVTVASQAELLDVGHWKP
jgi:hypothetical protein